MPKGRKKLKTNDSISEMNESEINFQDQEPDDSDQSNAPNDWFGSDHSDDCININRLGNFSNENSDNERTNFRKKPPKKPPKKPYNAKKAYGSKLYEMVDANLNTVNSQYKFKDAEENPEDYLVWLNPDDSPIKNDFIEPLNPESIELNELFSSTFTEEFFQKISDYTNEYFRQYMLKTYINKGEKIPKVFQDFNTNAEDIKKYLAVNIYMGLNKINSKKFYFRSNTILTNQFVSNIMGFGRFNMLGRFLHFNDNSGHSSDPLIKVRYPLTFFENIWLRLYVPFEHLTIDETMIPFHGTVKFRLYVPRKPNPQGMKAYSLCTGLQGYMIKWILYTGDNGPVEDTVVKLLEGFEHQGYKVYTDNYFTSVSLLEKLQKLGIGLTGVLRPSRKIITEALANTNTKENNIKLIARKCANFILTCWQDGKRNVPILTSVYNHKIVKFIRQKQNGKRYEANMPLVIRMYSKFIHGVDQANAKASFYRFKVQSHKWYKYVFFYALDVTITNMHTYYRQSREIKNKKKSGPEANNSQYTRTDYTKGTVENPLVFRMKLIEYLTKYEQKIIKRPNKNDNPKRLTEKHFIAVDDEIKPVKTRFCWVCIKKGKKGVVVNTYCEECSIDLCLKNCFKEYHTQRYYGMNNETNLIIPLMWNLLDPDPLSLWSTFKKFWAEFGYKKAWIIMEELSFSENNRRKTFLDKKDPKFNSKLNIPKRHKNKPVMLAESEIIPQEIEVKDLDNCDALCISKNKDLFGKNLFENFMENKEENLKMIENSNGRSSRVRYPKRNRIKKEKIRHVDTIDFSTDVFHTFEEEKSEEEKKEPEFLKRSKTEIVRILPPIKKCETRGRKRKKIDGSESNLISVAESEQISIIL